MGTCYWNHDVKPADTYICLDATNQVCPRCCVEKYAVETPASVLDRIDSQTLLEAFRGYGSCGYDNLVYFAACSVLCGPEGEKFARDFLTASGCRAIIGYTTPVDWMQSLVTDLLFCSVSIPILILGRIFPIFFIR